MSEIAYRIRSDYPFPDIYINREHAKVVSCSYQYVTTPDCPLAATNVFTATIILNSEDDDAQHVLSVNESTGETWYQ